MYSRIGVQKLAPTLLQNKYVISTIDFSFYLYACERNARTILVYPLNIVFKEQLLLNPSVLISILIKCYSRIA